MTIINSIYIKKQKFDKVKLTPPRMANLYKSNAFLFLLQVPNQQTSSPVDAMVKNPDMRGSMQYLEDRKKH